MCEEDAALVGASHQHNSRQCDGRQSDYEVQSPIPVTYYKSFYLRSIVAENDIYCILTGNITNVSDLCTFYGVTQLTNEAMLVVEMYRVTRNFSYCRPTELVNDFSGNFSFVLFDARSKTLFAGRDNGGWEGVNLLWGMVDDRSLAFSDNAEVILDMCGRSSTYFPRGCIYMNETGLSSYVHPREVVKAFVNRDENGEPCAISFAVDI